MTSNAGRTPGRARTARTRYCVIDIPTGFIAYSGVSLSKAAKALRPGRTCGQGPTEAEAFEQASDQRVAFLTAGYALHRGT